MSIKSVAFTIIASLLFLSCQQQTDLQKQCNCKEVYLQNLEETKDTDAYFSVKLPNTWKVNLYKDNYQSSIYAADTIKELTSSILLDVNYMQHTININDLFKLKIEQDNLVNNLIQKKGQEISFLGKPSYFTLAFGKKDDYTYQQLQVFSKIDNKNALLATAIFYGDSLVEKRICSAISLLEKIKIQ
ncbi:hypothetical protein [Polaribacter sp.]|uniref:hypothetical protein n=1 Tax=Polaribacter sp. TaxID=1920175 RepID=UPI003F6D0688